MTNEKCQMVNDLDFYPLEKTYSLSLWERVGERV
jgi:hypothetical protein